MDNQKQIKEMREDIELAIANGKKDSWYIEADLPDWIAESLDHKGYRKIPENAVVLTREELQARDKELAEKFAKILENRLESIDTILHEDNEEVYLSANELGELIDEICKEITEGKGNENG